MYGNGNGAEKSWTGGTAMPMQSPPRVPLITDQLQGLEKRTSVLHDAIGRVTERLGAVLAPEPPQNEASAKPPMHGVSLADALMELNGRVEYAITRLNSLATRIEV